MTEHTAQLFAHLLGVVKVMQYQYFHQKILNLLKRLPIYIL